MSDYCRTYIEDNDLQFEFIDDVDIQALTYRDIVYSSFGNVISYINSIHFSKDNCFDSVIIAGVSLYNYCFIIKDEIIKLSKLTFNLGLGLEKIFDSDYYYIDFENEEYRKFKFDDNEDIIDRLKIILEELEIEYIDDYVETDDD